MFPTRRITTSGGDVFRDEYSLAFDGSDDHIRTSFKSDYIHTNATMAMWVKMGDFTGSQLMGNFGNADGEAGQRWYMGFSSANGKFGIANQVGTIALTPTAVAGEWFHMAIVADGGTGTLYWNGNAMGTLTYTQDSDHNPAKGFPIGGIWQQDNDSGTEHHMNCNISDVVQYNGALTPSQIKHIYNGREPYNHKEGPLASKLEAWWRMGDGALDRVEASGGNQIFISDESKPTVLNTNNILTNNTFTVWDSPTSYGDDPTNWVLTNSDAANFITDITPGIRITFTDAVDFHLSQTNVTTVGNIYQAKMTIAAISGEDSKMKFSSGDVTLLNATTALAGPGIGYHVCYFRANSTTLFISNSGADGVADISSVALFSLSGNPGAGYGGLTNTVTSFEGDTP